MGLANYRLLSLLVVAFWLPFQAVAAIAMPFCRHGEAHQAALAVEEAAEHCAMHPHQAGTEPGAVCDDCAFCHLASAGFVPAAMPHAAAIPAGRDFLSWPKPDPASNFTEPPQRPPKRLA
jgi:hypothetical protein